MKTASSEETFSMNLSLAVGVVMLGLKWSAYLITGSAAAFSDALETVVHVAAVSFAAYSLRVVYRPPDGNHHFGHDKIAFFSSGAEGALVMGAGLVIIYEALKHWLSGIHLQEVGTGDVWTSAGAVGGLALAWWTGLTFFDPLVAILSALYILREGSLIVRHAAQGLMDTSNPRLEALASTALQTFCAEELLTYHRFRLRESGARIYIDFHLQFPDGVPIEVAHAQATRAERLVADALPQTADITSHLESAHAPDHDEE
jgi:divalent metal cation (Fe/Co/Zn/Cd) transporter